MPAAQDDKGKDGRIEVREPHELAVKVPPADPAPSYRRPDPTQIQAPPGYSVEAFAGGLDFPIDIAFGEHGEAYIAESGNHGFGSDSIRTPSPQIIRLRPDGTKFVVYENTVPSEVIRKFDSSNDMSEGIIPPITGLTWHDGKLYVRHRSRVSVLEPTRGDQTSRFRTIVNGLPEWGTFLGGKVIFDNDGKMIFFVSTQSNAGVVDENMAQPIMFMNKLKAHDVPGEDVVLDRQELPGAAGEGQQGRTCSFTLPERAGDLRPGGVHGTHAV